MRKHWFNSHYFFLTLVLLIIVADQIIKALIVTYIPVNTLAVSWGNGFFQLVHVRNLGAAFSLADHIHTWSRWLVLIIFPLIILSYLFYILLSKKLVFIQKLILAFIIGGGFGNLIDRVCRPAGVVDYLNFKIYGLFGMQYWPVFNLADTFVSLGIILFVLMLFFQFFQRIVKKNK